MPSANVAPAGVGFMRARLCMLSLRGRSDLDFSDQSTRLQVPRRDAGASNSLAASVLNPVPVAEPWQISYSHICAYNSNTVGSGVH